MVNATEATTAMLSRMAVVIEVIYRARSKLVIGRVPRSDHQRGPRRRVALDDAEAELRRLIREGFQQGITGEKLAEAAGLSVPRVYQIRDGR
jgi:hypothetical protein